MQILSFYLRIWTEVNKSFEKSLFDSWGGGGGGVKILIPPLFACSLFSADSVVLLENLDEGK